MASTLFMNCGTKVRSVIGHLSPLSQQMNVSVKFHPNYQSIQNAVVAHNYSTTTTTSSSSSSSSSPTTIDQVHAAKPIPKSTNKSQSIKSVPDNEIKKSVFISQSNDIFTNLALEDWFYRNFDFTKHHVLMLWANDPCVVIGRHQNPFDEANVSNLQKAGITLARRNR